MQFRYRESRSAKPMVFAVSIGPCRNVLQQKVNDERREVRPVCLVVCLLDAFSLQLSRPTSNASDRLGFLCHDKDNGFVFDGHT
jgi:hypothetical protein